MSHTPKDDFAAAIAPSFIGGPLYIKPYLPEGLSEVERLRKTVQFLEERVTQLSQEGQTMSAMVYKVDPKEVILQVPDGRQVMVRHPGVPLKPGQVVRIQTKTGAIIGDLDVEFIGPVAEVQQVVSPTMVEIEHGGQRRLTRLVGIEAERGDRIVLNPDTAFAFRNIGKAIEAANGPVAVVRQSLEGSVEVEVHNHGRMIVRAGQGLPEVKKGDRVILDRALGVAVKLLPRQEDGLAFAGDTGATWSDVKGQDEAVQALIEAIEEPVKHAPIYALFDQPPAKGVLLSGPPGTGKTLLGRAAATALAALHGKKASASGYAYVKGPELMEKWIGSSEGNVRRIFSNARAHSTEHGYPQLVFIDECESLLAARTRRESHGGNIDVAVVQTFLAELDGLEATGAFFLLATNRPGDIDPAVLRDGRITRSVELKRPDQKKSVAVLKHHLGKKKPLELPHDEMAEKVAALVFDPRHVLAMINGASSGRHKFTLGHCATGALLEGVVRKATQGAIRRCIADKKAKRVVTLEDFVGAVDEAFREAQQKGFAEATADFVKGLSDGDTAKVVPAGAKSESPILIGRA